MSKANETYAQPRKNVSINIFTPIHCIRRDGLVRKTKQGKTKHLNGKTERAFERQPSDRKRKRHETNFVKRKMKRKLLNIKRSVK